MHSLGIAKLTAPLVLALGLAAQTIPADTEPVTKLESGLEFSVLTAGDGERKPMPHELVRVHYTGWLTNGEVFDSSHQRGEPAVFPLNGVIAGWTEGLQHMTVGARHKLSIPADLAYGPRGRPGIPPNSNLIFEVELLGIQPACPEFDDAKAEVRDDGLKCQKLASGAGKAKTDGDIPVYDFAFYGEDGTLQQGTWKNGQRLPPHIVERLTFLESLGEQHVGDEWRIDVPPGKGLSPPQMNRTERWVLRLSSLLKPLPVPAFKDPTDDRIETSASGLKYQIVKQGKDGDRPNVGDEVTVHYAGWLEDGTLFDSSFERGEPSSFQLGRVIEGWNEGLALMTPGSTFILKIPSELGYGARGSAPTIPPDATLIFYVELISFSKK